MKAQDRRLPKVEEFSTHRSAAKIAVGYAVVSWIYILVSDRLVALLTQDVSTLVLINSAKGSVFVIVTALGLYALSHSQLGKMAELYERYVRGAQKLESAYEEIAANDEELRAQFNLLEEQNKQLADQKQEIERLAYSDQLTGLPNKTKLLDLLRGELERPDGTPAVGTLFFIDMDDLKMVNDTFGHSYGDAMIITASTLLVGVMAQFVGPSYISRIGGDEFIVMIPGLSDRTAIERMASEVVANLSREYEVKEASFHASASVGIALYPENGSTVEELLKNADAALYDAKRQGKGCWKFYHPALQQAVYERIVMANHLRHAIEANELYVVYQPQQNLATGEIVAFEALLRWRSAHHGNVSPAQFIPIAEKSGLIEMLGEWVLRQSCRFSKRLVEAGHADVRVAVNVSSQQLAADDFLEKVKNTISAEEASCNQIEIEITESVLLEPMEENIEKLRSLHACGIGLALDDFGTGYSSLTYLRKLPVDVVKIDKSFIDSIADESAQVALVASVIQMAHVLGLKVVAEGVETLEQRNALCQCGCDILQGYLLSRPLPEDEALWLLETGGPNLAC